MLNTLTNETLDKRVGIGLEIQADSMMIITIIDLIIIMIIRASVTPKHSTLTSAAVKLFIMTSNIHFNLFVSFYYLLACYVYYCSRS